MYYSIALVVLSRVIPLVRRCVAVLTIISRFCLSSAVSFGAFSAGQALRLRAECESLREELNSCRRQTGIQLTELRDKVAALTQVNTQLERAARPEDANP